MPALQRVVADRAPGEVVAVTGPSGCGKSTLLAVLLGLVRPERPGSVTRRRRRPRRPRPGRLAPHVAWVPQRPHLFARSIADNVRLGRPDATDDEVAGRRSRPPGSTTWSCAAARGRRHACSATRGRSLGRRTAAGRPGPGLPARRAAAPARRATASLDGDTEEDVLAAVRRLIAGRTVVHRGAPALRSRSGRPGRRASPVTWRPVADGERSRDARVASRRCRSPDARPGPAGCAAPPAWRPARGGRHRRRHRPDGHLGLADLARRPAPDESALALAIVAVQFFGLSRGFLRYGERLVGHDAAFRLLADLRVRSTSGSKRSRPAGLPASGAATCWPGSSHDVDSLQDLVLRVIPPFAIAAAGRLR